MNSNMLLSPLEMTKNGDDIYPPHLLAKRLSNRASFLITRGTYDESIVLLTKALKLTEKKLYTTTTEQSFPCNFCSLESCVGMKQDSYTIILNSEKKEYYNNHQNEDENDHCGLRSYRCKEDRHIKTECKHDENHEGYQHEAQEHGFVYRRPILVPKLCVEEDHYMGMVLSLIILYNLALAHHLKAISMSDFPSARGTLSRDNIRVVNQSLKLYELAYQLLMVYEEKIKSIVHLRERNEESAGSLRFTIIISNNLGQIHKLAGDYKKHQICLQHLLCAIMYMVDSHRVVLDSSEMDGFYRNVAPIMICDNCANAA